MATGLGGPCTETKREERAPLGSWDRFAGASWEDGELETGWHLDTDGKDPGESKRVQVVVQTGGAGREVTEREVSRVNSYRSTAGGPSKEIRDESRLQV